LSIDPAFTSVAASIWLQHYFLMGRDSTDRNAPDLFSFQGVGKPLPKRPLDVQGTRKPNRPALPKDLSKSVKYLDDKDLDRLVVAVFDEARRRGRLPPGLGRAVSAGSAGRVGRLPPALQINARSQKPKIAVPPLTRGQRNAVRAAFKAGVRPVQIARQFGLSPSDVRKVLASEESE
jgi:hypothetical protein